MRNKLLVFISPGCTIGFCTSIHQSLYQSINQYISKSSFVRNRLLVIISPGCTIGFCTSIHQSEYQSINSLANQFTAFFLCNCVKHGRGLDHVIITTEHWNPLCGKKILYKKKLSESTVHKFVSFLSKCNFSFHFRSALWFQTPS